MNNKREASTSITHLVKTVAKEVVDRELDVLSRCQVINEKRLFELERVFKEPFLPDLKDFLYELKSDLEEAGQPWMLNEDKKLAVEVETILTYLAKRHSRSVGAIRSRIKQRDLIRG